MESLVFDEGITSMFSDVVALRRALGVFLRVQCRKTFLSLDVVGVVFRLVLHFYPDVRRVEAHRTNGGPRELGWARSWLLPPTREYQRTDARSLAAA